MSIKMQVSPKNIIYTISNVRFIFHHLKYSLFRKQVTSKKKKLKAHMNETLIKGRWKLVAAKQFDDNDTEACNVRIQI